MGRRHESALGSRRSPNFLGVRSAFVLLRPTFLVTASTPSSSSSSSRRCHRLPRYPSLPSDVKRRAREAGYTARLAPSFCDLAPGVSRGWVAAFNLPRGRCLGPSRSALNASLADSVRAGIAPEDDEDEQGEDDDEEMDRSDMEDESGEGEGAEDWVDEDGDLGPEDGEADEEEVFDDHYAPF